MKRAAFFFYGGSAHESAAANLVPKLLVLLFGDDPLIKSGEFREHGSSFPARGDWIFRHRHLELAVDRGERAEFLLEASLEARELDGPTQEDDIAP